MPSTRVSSAALLFVIYLASAPNGAHAHAPNDLIAAAVAGKNVASLMQERIDKDGYLQLPCGVFEVQAAVQLGSGTRVQGAGHCTVLKMARSMPPATLHAMFVPKASKTLRAIFTNRLPGDSNIIVRDLTLDGAASPGNAHLISFYRASNVLVEGVRFLGAGSDAVQDGVSMIASSDYVVRRNTCSKIRNACYDQWDGSERFEISDNVVEGGDLLTYGILINGISTAYTDATTSNFTVRGNRISAVRHLGIGAYGLCSPDMSLCGVVTDGVIERNEINGVREYYGIWVGNARRVTVTGNTIRDAKREAIRVASQNSGGQTGGVAVRANAIFGSGGGPGITIGTNVDRTSDVRVELNNVTGYRVTVKVAPSTRTIIVSP
jgi:hypothetical protein